MSVNYPGLVAESATMSSATVVALPSTAATIGGLTTRTFAGAVTDGDLSNGDTVMVTIVKDATNWVRWLAAYSSSGNTLTRSTLLEAKGTVTTSDAVTVFVSSDPDYLIQSDTTGLTGATQVNNIVAITTAGYGAIGTPDANTIYHITDAAAVNHTDIPGYIDGLAYSMASGATTVTLDANLEIDINGTVYSVSSGTLTETSGTEALSADSLYYFFLVDDSGVVKLHKVKRTDATDDPVWDADLNYWKGGTGFSTSAPDYRYIGYGLSDGSSQWRFMEGVQLPGSRTIKHVHQWIGVASSLPTSGVYTAVGAQAWLPVTAIRVGCSLRVQQQNAWSDVRLTGTSSGMPVLLNAMGSYTQYHVPNHFIPINGRQELYWYRSTTAVLAMWLTFSNLETSV